MQTFLRNIVLSSRPRVSIPRFLVCYFRSHIQQVNGNVLCVCVCACVCVRVCICLRLDCFFFSHSLSLSLSLSFMSPPLYFSLSCFLGHHRCSRPQALCISPLHFVFE